MARFRYQAVSADGQPVAGELEADSVQQVARQLEASGLTVRSISFATLEASAAPDDAASTIAQAARPSSTKPTASADSSSEQAVLRSHMEKVLERGQAIAPALRAYAEEMPAGRQRRQLQAVYRVLERGDTTEATAALLDLPEFWIPLLSATTSSSDPGRVLREFLVESRRTDDLRQQWWLTLAYPLLIVGLALAVLTILSILVAPVFRGIFEEFDLDLPGITVLVLNAMSLLTSWGVVVVGVVVATIMLVLLNVNRWLPLSVFAWLGDRFRVPFARGTAIARFARFTADLLEAGLTRPDALRIAGFTVHGSRLQRAACGLANDIESGRGFSPRDYQGWLTTTVLHAVAADMPKAARVRLLREISTSHAERVHTGLSWTSGVIEPIAICVVGIVVGTVVLAMFLPLVKLVEGLSQ